MSMVGHLGELVGYKAGLALTREELAEHLLDAPDIRQAVLAEEGYLVRVRSEEYEAAVHELLYRVGNLPTPHPLPPALAVLRRFEHDRAYSKVLREILSRCLDLLGDQIDNTPQGVSLNPSHLIQTVEAEFGRRGFNVAVALVDAILLAQQASPWASGRWINWTDTTELSGLFRSEGLETRYGAFLDQRFVDYLARNSERIDEVHWRKFEGLTGEFFDRAGFQVEMGPGRNDGGVDVRVWAPEDDTTKPPLVLVQCKRQQQTVSQVVVKALWADVSAEGAKSGLIVTTSALAPSAETVRTARGYQIGAVERRTLLEWLEQLRSPGSGTFLA